ncbi:hypothetical protein [Neobacillus sp.]|uniref:hypothetical protein n=1 Tax=Neobacillus sp. TaxID=2675273 RepID=UPI0028A211FA|nr:hypothetical protein [Neobacillus sp.]
MKWVKNEQGYALVTVLLIVTVFMIISLAFMGQALSSTKQNQVVEKKARAVSSAEMGISYYQVEIQRLFESKQQLVNDKVSVIMKNNSPQTNFKKEAARLMAGELQKEIPVGSTPARIQIDGHPNASFVLRDFVAVADPDVNSNKVNISFHIIGTEDGKDTTLLTKMYIDLDSIMNLPTSGPENNYVLPTYNNILKPQVPCKTLSCKPVYIDGPGDFEGNNLLSNNQTIYTTGSLTLNGQGNENNTTVVKIHADGPITIGKNMNNQTNLTIETNDNATFGQNLKVDTTSKVLVRKTLSVAQHLNISNDSFIYVGENAKVNLLDISSSSKMCVRGDLTAGSISVSSSNPPGKLIVYGKVNGSTTSPYRVTDATFKSECGTYVPPDFQINWGDNINTVISNVDY